MPTAPSSWRLRRLLAYRRPVCASCWGIALVAGFVGGLISHGSTLAGAHHADRAPSVVVTVSAPAAAEPAVTAKDWAGFQLAHLIFDQRLQLAGGMAAAAIKAAKYNHGRVEAITMQLEDLSRQMEALKAAAETPAAKPRNRTGPPRKAAAAEPPRPPLTPAGTQAGARVVKTLSVAN